MWASARRLETTTASLPSARGTSGVDASWGATGLPAGYVRAPLIYGPGNIRLGGERGPKKEGSPTNITIAAAGGRRRHHVERGTPQPPDRGLV